MSCGLTDPVGCVTDVIGGAAKTAADSAFNAIAHDFGQAADSAVNWLWGQISAATAVSLGGPGFGSEVAITGTIAATIGLGLFIIQVIASVLRREPGGLGRATRGLLVAFVAGGLSIAIVDVSLAAVDSLSAGVVHVATGGTINQMGAQLLAPTALAAVSNGAVVILLSLVIVAACVVVWAALMVRKLLIIVAAVFAPIAFAGSLADITSAWVRRWIETMAALIFSKLILVIIFTIGLGVLAGGVGQSPQAAAGGATQSLTQIVTGALILVMAGLSPWLAIKLVHFTGESFHAIHSQATSAATSAQLLSSTPRKIAALRPAPSSGNGPTGSSPTPGGPQGQSPTVSTQTNGTARPGAASSSGIGSASGGTPSAGSAAGSAGAVAGAAVIAGKTAIDAAKAAGTRVAETGGVGLPPPSTPPPRPKAPDPEHREG